MHRPDIVELKDFYSNILGGIVGRRIKAKIRKLWPEIYVNSDHVEQLIVCNIGYGLPYLPNKQNAPIVAVMPAAQGACQWPLKSNNRTILSKETYLPFDDESIDRAMITHSLEYSSYPIDMMREVYRILQPEGKIIIIVPNRMSIWSRSDKTPFGYGHPHSPLQLENLLKDCYYEILSTQTALFFPPTQSRFILKLARWFNKIGKKISWPGTVFRLWGGVVIIEAQKQVYAPNIILKKSNTRSMIYQPATGGFSQSTRKSCSRTDSQNH